MKQQFIAALIGAAIAFPVAAQAEGYFVGGNVGRSEQKLSIDGLGSIKDTGTGFKLNGGYQFNANYGVEVAYVNLGKAEVNAQGTYAKSEPQTVFVAATGTLPLNNEFSLFGKVGVAQNHVKLSVRESGFSGSDSENRTTAVFGIGAAYHLNKNVSFVAEYENFGKIGNGDGASLKADLLSVGVRYSF
ncbi:outer membrane beta-barrel protein [Rugamonas sp. CCM 8940]|uniref:outer membrane beta-barrel protein n=1 Tax=Rugamonas sp. CCM 8940 TaxID=2765359 RepID=UPI0018F60442|nr:outer membrane beta-barrel protein [Rugamonas sp. CCM 8940]MBJ7312295.1 outer membrane beta-barrel protein [Rugamonas sp. CCM 8940]